MHPVLIDFGLFKLHTYGLMIALGFLVGMQLATREARRVDLSPKKDFDQFVLDLTFWILIVAMVGSRILFIIVEWERDYARDPLKIFRVWEGGLVFYGGFVASVLFSAYYCKRKGKDFFLVSDTLIPSVALGHFFGRLGCLAAGCCWGGQVDPSFPLGIRFPPGSLAFNSMQHQNLIGYDALWTMPVHPVQLYESTGELILFFILLAMRTRKRFHGQVLLTYLFVYSILRSSLEMLRGDKARGVDIIFGLSTSQLISALISISAVAIFVYLQKKRGAIQGPAPAAAA
ncbi:prolipoprotein diacylglyceryl transferase [Myxococcota bacterium]|nr:prolipoprotein diacylglyceryl transferase [Myxococcota bacterium]